jgi:hypothetical protein
MQSSKTQIHNTVAEERSIQDRVSKDGGAIMLSGSQDPIAGVLQPPVNLPAAARPVAGMRRREDPPWRPGAVAKWRAKHAVSGSFVQSFVSV